MLAIDISALERQIDKAGDDAVVPNGNLAQHEGLFRNVLQCRQHFAQGARRLVDLVDEQQVRDAEVGQPLQIGLQHKRLVGLWLADHDGYIDARQHVRCFLQKFDGARAIEDGETFVHVMRGGCVHFHAHLAGASFRGRITHRVLGRHRTFARNRAGDGKNAFQERRLAAPVRSHQGHCTWPTSSVLSRHSCLSLKPRRPDAPARNRWAATCNPLSGLHRHASLGWYASVFGEGTPWIFCFPIAATRLPSRPA